MRKPTAVMQAWAKSAIASYEELRSEDVSPCSCMGRASDMWPMMLSTLKGSDAMVAGDVVVELYRCCKVMLTLRWRKEL
jgi:hypothetical protein